jgi:mRNA interferase MazF
MAATYQRGDVVLVTLTYSDQLGVKKRPVVVLRDVGDADLLVAPVTGQASRTRYDVPLADWQEEGLKLPSVVRTEKLATVEKSTVIRYFGRLSRQDWNAVEISLVAVFREIAAF